MASRPSQALRRHRRHGAGPPCSQRSPPRLMGAFRHRRPSRPARCGLSRSLPPGQSPSRGRARPGTCSPLAAAPQRLPPDVAAAWDHVRDLDLRLLAGRLLPDAGLAGLAAELRAEVDQRRQLIVPGRTFAPPPRRTYGSLAAELGVTRERVRQLEADALGKLAQAAADDRYAPLRWRAASPARPGAAEPRAINDAPPWMECLLAWLPENTA